MIKSLRVFPMLLALCILLGVNCGVPRAIWPQRDIESVSMNEPELAHKLLIASRQSEFKNQIVEQIRIHFKDDSVYMKFIGLKDLKEESGSDYSAVVLINTCIAWGLDRNVQSFLKKNPVQDHMIILTTSANGGWMPNMKGRDFDAISAASKQANAKEMADMIIEKVRNKFEVI